jgi:hypothetical protein
MREAIDLSSHCRDSGLDELGNPTLRNREALLDIGATLRHRAEFASQLVVVVESPTVPAARIRQTLSRRLRPNARFGFASLLTVLLAGLLLPPMVGCGISFAAEEPSPAASGKAPDDVNSQETPPVLTGRITDDKGAPVADAEVTLRGDRVPEAAESKTDADGRYRIAGIPVAGEYRVQIESMRCVGITHWTELPVLNLTPDSRVERDFTLSRACQLKILTVDEQGQPVALADVMAASLSEEGFRAPPSIVTDKTGVAIIGGLAPSDADYIVGVMHKDYGFEKLVVPLRDPEQVVSHTLVLRSGKSITGKAVCSDGKPPAGWRILALPSWWHFGRYPVGTTIAADGSFSLPRIVDGHYDVSISIPRGEGSFTSRPVLRDTDLLAAGEPLTVKLDYPSPESLVSITGRIKVVEGVLADGFWLNAESIDNDINKHSSVYVQSTAGTFKIEPIVRGEYRLTIDNAGIESRPLIAKAPATNVVLELIVRGKPVLRGTVLRDDTNEPVTEFRVRVRKLRTLRGPNFAEGSVWREFNNDAGEFELPVAGPGIYQVEATAPGFAWVLSESINTDEESDNRVRIPLVAGFVLKGRVVDEEGAPIDGATVQPLSKSTLIPGSPEGHEFDPHDVATTVSGDFLLEHLREGEENLRVTHPDYCFGVVPYVVTGSEHDERPLTITMTRGGTLRGRVFDVRGQPEPNVSLIVQGSEGVQPRTSFDRLATAVTNAEGYYEVHHLPEQLCYVHRAEEWNCLGVVRHCILPRNGRVHTLDLGGGAKLHGRLLINAEPLAGGRVVLSGESPHFGIFKAYATTAEDGSFSFTGLPPGNRVLHYAIPGRLFDWARVADVRLSFQDVDLGVIDHPDGKIIVQLDPPHVADAAGIRVYLQNQDPVWTAGNVVGISDPTQHEFGRFVIDHVPVGKYEAVCHTETRIEVREPVEVTREYLSQTVTVQVPLGTASLAGRIDSQFRDPQRYRSFRLWSEVRRLLAYLAPDEQGNYKLEQLPAGNYVIRETDLRDSEVLLEVPLREGENRVLDLTPETISRAPTPPPRGYLSISVFTTEGVPLPCNVGVTGPQGDLTPHASGDGRVSFMSEPGEYMLHVSHPGFKPVDRAVTLREMKTDGNSAADAEVRILLEVDR